MRGAFVVYHLVKSYFRSIARSLHNGALLPRPIQASLKGCYVAGVVDGGLVVGPEAGEDVALLRSLAPPQLAQPQSLQVLRGPAGGGSNAQKYKQHVLQAAISSLA